jgi:hypothetical protein
MKPDPDLPLIPAQRDGLIKSESGEHLSNSNLLTESKDEDLNTLQKRKPQSRWDFIRFVSDEIVSGYSQSSVLETDSSFYRKQQKQIYDFLMVPIELEKASSLVSFCFEVSTANSTHFCTIVVISRFLDLL